MSSSDPDASWNIHEVQEVQSATAHPETYTLSSKNNVSQNEGVFHSLSDLNHRTSTHSQQQTSSSFIPRDDDDTGKNSILQNKLSETSEKEAWIPADAAERGDIENQDPSGKIYPRVNDPDAFIYTINPDSPHLAVNWPFSRKLRTTAVYSWAAFCSTYASSVFSGPTEVLPKLYHIGMTVSLLGTSLFICGYGCGPVVWGPLSELFGRKSPVAVGMFGFAIFNIAVAVAKDIQTIMICRFFSGFCASSPMAIVAAAFADMYSNRHRGTAITIFAALVFGGPLLSPIISGFITKSYLGWRWTEYITSFMGFFAVVIVVFCCEETYAKKIVENSAQLYRSRNNNYFVHALTEEQTLTPQSVLKNYLLIPIKLLFTEPIVFLVTLYSSFVYGILYLLLEAYPIIFSEKRHFSMGVAELPYIGLLVGVFIGSGINIAFEPWYFRQVLKLGGKPYPEGRLPPLIIGAFIFPAGIFWMAWSGNYTHVHWVVPSLSGLLTGAGILLIFLNCLNYLIDAYLFRAASAMAANTMMRSSVAAGFPLFAIQMFHNLGIGWAGSVLGFIAIALIPVPIVFYFFGRKIRSWSKMTVVM
ncbi:spermidine family transporter [Schizosaccharomyces octosporus yFS286]|uniref:Spermidine family transporter n=1 Tax=Schizosaccharomyces octosporus (strain yFS286) TaxID=483514 RepID=S9Q6X3_SCHOY|nr:spermidine family transporter [Schizosaccharomyces octosporus yFS286]EPX75393.1 spermidine family transporter [Schizosaccharomyces octosporus yFS286]